MAPWLALSVGLWLGQTPGITPTLPPGADTQDPAALEQLRAEVEALQAQVNSVQQQLTGIRDSAAELELMRQQRLAEIERAGTWLLAADQALAVGELDVGDALLEADTALAQVVQSATEAGSGRTVVHIEGARGALVRARDATGRRDIYQARWDLFDAAEHLREARRQNLDEASTTTITR
jgi:hypothetical protein